MTKYEAVFCKTYVVEFDSDAEDPRDVEEKAYDTLVDELINKDYTQWTIMNVRELKE